MLNIPDKAYNTLLISYFRERFSRSDHSGVEYDFILGFYWENHANVNIIILILRNFLAPTGAQGMLICVHLFGPSLSRALNLHLFGSESDLQAALSALSLGSL